MCEQRSGSARLILWFSEMQQAQVDCVHRVDEREGRRQADTAARANNNKPKKSTACTRAAALANINWMTPNIIWHPHIRHTTIIRNVNLNCHPQFTIIFKYLIFLFKRSYKCSKQSVDKKTVISLSLLTKLMCFLALIKWAFI